MNRRIFVALSGGVDSAIAAYLLQQQGYAVEGIYMRTWQSQESLEECPWRADLESARAVAAHLAIPFSILSLIENYRQCVADPLVIGYANGITPNPDALCNRHIKFGALLRYARARNFEILATGHYCRILQQNHGEFQLLEGADKNKDQSYFLALVDREVLPRVHFPLGELQKSQVRELASSIGLPNAQRKDSQGICFLGGKMTIQQFLDQKIASRPGEIVDLAGRHRGEHAGLHRYTLGQRHGIGLPSNCDFENWVVVAKDLASNRLIIAFESDKNNGLWRREFTFGQINFLSDRLLTAPILQVRPRYRDAAVAAEVQFFKDGTGKIQFSVPQRALAAGQIMAFYEGERLLGGAVFQ